jgi:hypothetical protein
VDAMGLRGMLFYVYIKDAISMVKMAFKLKKAIDKLIYCMRKSIVEPVMKHHQGCAWFLVIFLEMFMSGLR